MYLQIVIAFPETFKLFLINIVIPISTELRSHWAVKNSFLLPFVYFILFPSSYFSLCVKMEKMSYVVFPSPFLSHFFFFFFENKDSFDNELSFSRSTS